MSIEEQWWCCVEEALERELLFGEQPKLTLSSVYKLYMFSAVIGFSPHRRKDLRRARSCLGQHLVTIIGY